MAVYLCTHACRSRYLCYYNVIVVMWLCVCERFQVVSTLTGGTLTNHSSPLVKKKNTLCKCHSGSDNMAGEKNVRKIS